MLWWPNEVPVLQHGSVTLRPLEDTDIDAVYRACQDPVIPQFTRVISPYSREDAADFVRSSPFAFTERRAIQFAIDSGVGDEREFAGAISIHSIKLADHAGELGYWMAPEFRGKNICSTAAELITEFALDSIGFNRIEALVDHNNIASQKVLQKSGFEREGLLRKKVTKESGATVDMYIFARVSER